MLYHRWHPLHGHLSHLAAAVLEHKTHSISIPRTFAVSWIGNLLGGVIFALVPPVMLAHMGFKTFYTFTASTYSRYCSAACISRPTAGRAAATNQRHLRCGVGVRQGLDTTAFRVPASELGPPSLQELTLAPQRRRAPKPRCRQNIRGCQAPAACRLQAGLQGPQGPRAYNSPRSAPLLRGLSCVYGPRAGRQRHSLLRQLASRSCEPTLRSSVRLGRSLAARASPPQ